MKLPWSDPVKRVIRDGFAEVPVVAGRNRTRASNDELEFAGEIHTQQPGHHPERAATRDVLTYRDSHPESSNQTTAHRSMNRSARAIEGWGSIGSSPWPEPDTERHALTLRNCSLPFVDQRPAS
jgi:hypothetical protein